MLKEKIDYVDYNGVKRSEYHYFNFSRAELTEMELSLDGGLAETINKLVETQDIPSIIKIFKKLVLDAYGEKSADGKRFIKSEELSTAFSQTEAYSVLFMKLATDADAAAKFIKGIMPDDMKNDIDKAPALITN